MAGQSVRRELERRWPTPRRCLGDIVTGIGGKQILLEDPSGNPIELFEPTLPEASLNQPS
jgi:hypothetical protein